jgi:hypothetical protein
MESGDYLCWFMSMGFWRCLRLYAGGLCPPPSPWDFLGHGEERLSGWGYNEGEAGCNGLSRSDAIASFLPGYPWAGCVPALPACVWPESVGAVTTAAD